MNYHELSASEARALIRSGRLSAEALARDCIDRIEARDSAVRAWVHVDAEHVMAQATAADVIQRDGKALGLLHGIPVAIKDIFDTIDYPTQWGSSLLKGRQPNEDSAVVTSLRKAGAVIVGKTVTTEFASFAPGPTRNPHDLTRTPGGSSSGSAAAVADCMVPLALGSQTAGSTIRPGSFCGVVAFKPQFGAISRFGCMTLSSSLDHVGLYARTLDDIALLTQVLYGPDPRDASAGTVRLVGSVSAPSEYGDLKPHLGFAPTPFWGRMDSGAMKSFEQFVATLQIERVELPPDFRRACDALHTICDAEVAQGFAELHREGGDQFSPEFRREYEQGARITAHAYLDALKLKEELSVAFDELVADYDGLITPAVLGEAPIGLASTGDPIFCSPWTLIGHPAVCLPLLKGDNGLPLGVQVIGKRCGDVALLRTASALL